MSGWPFAFTIVGVAWAFAVIVRYMLYPPKCLVKMMVEDNKQFAQSKQNMQKDVKNELRT